MHHFRKKSNDVAFQLHALRQDHLHLQFLSAHTPYSFLLVASFVEPRVRLSGQRNGLRIMRSQSQIPAMTGDFIYLNLGG